MRISRIKLLTGALMAAIAVAPALAVATPAAADTPFNWSQGNPQVGCSGGQSTGGYVVAVQSIVGTYGTYLGYIDNQYGNISLQAVRNYQARRGLTADGCVGPQTWANMQLLINYRGNEVCPFGTYSVYGFDGSGGTTSNFARGTAWTTQTDNPTASPVQRYKEYLQTQALTIIC